MSSTANKSISLLDLKAQYSQIQDEVEKAVIDVLRSGWYVLGPNVQTFEKEAAEFLNTKNELKLEKEARKVKLVRIHLETNRSR